MNMTSDKDLEHLSASMDDELPAQEALAVLSALGRDPELRLKRQRQELVRLCLQGGKGAVPASDFSLSVREAIDREPPILAPSAFRRPLGERMATFALAASIAVVSVLVVRSVSHYSPEQASQILANVNLTTPVVRASMEPDLRDYINMHHESTYLSGSQGVMPSVRLVGGSSGR